MTISVVDLLAHRPFVSDSVLLDWADLACLVKPQSSVTVRQLRDHWHCSQPAVSRRISAIHRAGLACITPGYGRYRVWSVSGLTVAA